MATDAQVKHSLDMGRKYPYDDRPPTDQAHLAALGVLADLKDRRGIKKELEEIDADLREELVDSLASIIRSAMTIA